MTQIWDFQRREWESNNIPKREWRFRPILPIVFYTGEQRWQTPLTFGALMDVPDILAKFVPKFETLFLSVKRTDPSTLTKTDHPFGWLLTVLRKEHANKQEIRTALIEAVKHINTLEPEKVQQWRRSIFYLYLLIIHRRSPEEHDELKTLVHQHIQETSYREEGEKMVQTMAEHLIEQGETRGRTQAKREDILKLLRLRFETVPESVTNKISAIRSLSRLDSLFEKAATAQTLDDFDWENG